MFVPDALKVLLQFTRREISSTRVFQRLDLVLAGHASYDPEEWSLLVEILLDDNAEDAFRRILSVLGQHGSLPSGKVRLPCRVSILIFRRPF
jgi:hypothetical protein